MITFLEGLKSCNKTQEDVFAFFSNKKKTQVYYYIFSITTSHAGANQKILHMQPFIETLFHPRISEIEKHPWRSVAFSRLSNFTKSNIPPWVFFNVF